MLYYCIIRPNSVVLLHCEVGLIVVLSHWRSSCSSTTLSGRLCLLCHQTDFVVVLCHEDVFVQHHVDCVVPCHWTRHVVELCCRSLPITVVLHPPNHNWLFPGAVRTDILYCHSTLLCCSLCHQTGMLYNCIFIPVILYGCAIRLTILYYFCLGTIKQIWIFR